MTVRVYFTNTGKMMHMTLDVLNGEARVAGDTVVGGEPGTGDGILVDFRDLVGGFTGKLFPTGHLVDTIPMDDGSSIDVTITDLANFCLFFDPTSFGIGYTGLELPSPAGTVLTPPGMEQRLRQLRLKVRNALNRSPPGGRRDSLRRPGHESVSCTRLAPALRRHLTSLCSVLFMSP